MSATTADATAERILAAALRQAEEFGVRRFTMDDVARRAGVSRVTVYRHFARKDQLLEALLLRELGDFLQELDGAVGAYADYEDQVVEGLVFTMEHLRSHRLLQRLLRTEPELLLPQLTVGGGPAIATARAFVAEHARAAIAAGQLELREDDIDGIAELLVRIALSFVVAPQSVLEIDDPQAIRAFSRRYLGPVIAALRP